MPAKPIWYSRLNEILAELGAMPRSWVDRHTVEALLDVGPRRAQQIMAPCVVERVGASSIVDRERLMAQLVRLARGEAVEYEQRRRRKVGLELARLRQQALEQPRVMVEAPDEIVNQQLDHLPDGVRLEPGRITIEFGEPDQALEKLLALAMAIGNNESGFRRATEIQR